MSRIGKQPIEIPIDVEIKIDGPLIIVQGPKGQLERNIPAQIKASIQDKKIIFAPVGEAKENFALWGLSRALVANMLEGVTKGFEKKLEIQGVGFRAVLEGNKLALSLGFSHPVEMAVPQGIEISVEKNIITITGIDKELVGQTAANIRAKKKPEPYKGKGIRYLNEVVRRKAGKKAAVAA